MLKNGIFIAKYYEKPLKYHKNPLFHCGSGRVRKHEKLV